MSGSADVSALQVAATVGSIRRVGDYTHLTLVAPGVAERVRPGSFVALAVGGGWLLGTAMGGGLDGQFLAVALGIAAFGAVNAAAVRPGVWGPR